MKKVLPLFLITFLLFTFCSKKEGETINLDQEVDIEEYKKSLKPLLDMTILLVVAHSDFDEVEYGSSKNFFTSQGAKIETASTYKGEITSDHMSKLDSDFSISDVDVGKYSAIVFIGGMGAEDDYFNNTKAFGLIKAADEKGILLGASSISPAIFANAGVLTGKKATIYDDKEGADRAIFSKNGVEYTGENVTVDGNIVTCNHRDNIAEFCNAIVEELKE